MSFFFFFLSSRTNGNKLSVLIFIFRLASKTRMAVNRAFSFSKTPNRLKRAMSTVMSPLRSSNNSNLCDSSVISPMMNGGTVGMAASCANLAVSFLD